MLLPLAPNRIVRSLVEAKVCVRQVRAGSEGERAVRHLIERVFVQERCFLGSSETDLWDRAAYFYLLTSDGEPAGCLRIVDPAAFPEAALRLPRRNGRSSLPIEDLFTLEEWVTDCAEFFEPGRIVVVPAFRRKGAFVALMAATYLYARRRGKRGAVCLANPDVVGSFRATGWQALGGPLGPERYGEPAYPLRVLTDGVPECYQNLFLNMESHGIIEIG
jgi:GNAT superfamily N-acetyltransferase